jgi:hypothetical protein
MKSGLQCILVAGLFSACTFQQSAPPLLSRSISEEAGVRSALHDTARQQRLKVISKAQELLHAQKTFRSRGLQFQTDPMGFVQAAYWNGGIDLFDHQLAEDLDISGLVLLYQSARKRRQLQHSTPRPGDLVFFHSTPSTSATHEAPEQVGVIEAIEWDRTITVLGYFANGPRRIVINLNEKKRDYAADGKRMNDRLSLIRAEKGLPAGTLMGGFMNPFASLPQDIRSEP